MALARLTFFWMCIILAGFYPAVRAFYLPGVAPRDFNEGDELQVKVNKLSSIKTQLPYEYYSLGYCRPPKVVNSAENLGEVLRGDRIENSPYVFQMKEDKLCNVACKIDKLDAATIKAFREKIDDDYRVNMILDNLPVAEARQRQEGTETGKTYQRGYPVGVKLPISEGGEEKYFVFNHLAFTVLFHMDSESTAARIVGFEVIPFSVKHEHEKPINNDKPQLSTCNPETKQLVTGQQPPLEVKVDEEIIFTYDVKFQASDVKWASRWDTYLLMSDDQIHWFSIINSLMIVLFLSGMVAMIMMRTLYQDIARYNQLETQEEAQEETGWKLVHADVFRPPSHSGLLCVYVGTGVQFLGMTIITMIFAVFGFLSPSNRGGLMTAMLLLWAFMGIVAGYASARLFKIFKVPLVFIGSYFGFKKAPIEDPVRTNKIPRQIPEQAWYMRPAFSIFVGGILPFGAVFIELFFILTSIWLHQFYYIFGFLFIVFLILVVTCAEITITLPRWTIYASVKFD
ncbi:hypothetical protein GOP47_0029915 [Adiantum capillus-veneris]|nr:hypothetical protein GOP47_0029915 [Adiantum capillus-veneris]